jgi:benzil reductase ((S)-benzoin forming)
MKTIFITGTSRGIGYALLQELKKENSVFTIGRQQNDFYLDLSAIAKVEEFQFPKVNTNEVVLINNAGILGEIKRSFEKEKEDVQTVININTIAPIILCTSFIKKFANKKLTIINISSGAARRAIPSWANYCASKAAIDLFSETLQLELIEKNINGRVFSIAPGVVDTKMQEEIRNSKISDFSVVQKYIALKKQLFSPNFVAKKINSLIYSENKFEKVLLRIEDIAGI